MVQEFYLAATRKDRLGVSHGRAMEVIARLDIYPILPVTHELVMQAVETAQRFGIGYFDAAILTAARMLGCHRVYSEDLNAGQNYHGVTVVNPFAA